MSVVEDTITTSVDSLINLLNEVNKIELEEAAKKLKIPVSTVQSWVDFLVEEKIIGLEYKFTTPFIYLNKPKKEKKAEAETEEISIDNFKEEFHRKASEKQIPTHQAHDLWKNHLLQRVEKKREFLFREARKRGFFNPEELWIEYKNKLMTM